MGRWLAAGGFLALLTALSTSGCAHRTPSPLGRAPSPLDHPVADFSLTDQDGRTVTRADLLGKVWVASFLFTRCATLCPQVSATLAQLQHDTKGQDWLVLVSFTVDPDHDTPAVLKKYADDHGADPERWRFLTGEREGLYRLIRESFLVAVEQTQGTARTPGNEVTHSPKLMLVDKRGHVRYYFDGRKVGDAGEPVNELPQLEEKLTDLLRDQPWIGEEDLPSVNAVLNGTSAVLLALGYGAIRRRQIQLHKTCMLSALGVSAVFLTCYLYYHFGVKHGRPTPFLGQGWVRPVYFAILWSHMVLAAVMAPLALITASLGLRNRLSRHISVARWTLPIWLYVSITGVVVYWMLYRLYPPG
jgi:protein SCO1/2/putative membrane protein